MNGFLNWSGAALWAAIAGAVLVFLGNLLWHVGQATVFTVRWWRVYDGEPHPVREWLSLWGDNVLRPCDRVTLKSGRVVYWPGKEPVSKDFGATWERWLAVLDAELERRGHKRTIQGAHSWWAYYEDGFTPRDAVDEEFTHGS